MLSIFVRKSFIFSRVLSFSWPLSLPGDPELSSSSSSSWYGPLETEPQAWRNEGESTRQQNMGSICQFYHWIPTIARTTWMGAATDTYSSFIVYTSFQKDYFAHHQCLTEEVCLLFCVRTHQMFYIYFKPFTDMNNFNAKNWPIKLLLWLLQ